MRHCSCAGASLELFIKNISNVQISAVSRSAFQSTRANAISRRSSILLNTRLHAYSTTVGEQRNADASPPIPVLSNTPPPSPPRRDEGRTAGQDQMPVLRLNRLARKVKRMAAGTWQPIGQARLLAAKYERISQASSDGAGSSPRRARAKTTGNQTGGRKRRVRTSPKDASKGENVRKTAGQKRAATPQGFQGSAARARSARNKQTNTNVRSEATSGEGSSSRHLSGGHRTARRGHGQTSSQAVDADEEAVQSILRESQSPREPKARKMSRTRDKQLQVHAQAKERPAREKPTWLVQKEALKKKFGGQPWAPRKRLSPDSLNGIRALHASDRETYSTPVLAAHFKVSPEAVRRILKSNWQPKEEEIEDRRRRWEKRGKINRKEINEQKMRKRNAGIIRNIMNPRADPDLHELVHDEWLPPIGTGAKTPKSGNTAPRDFRNQSRDNRARSTSDASHSNV